jgi:hypothetical protein
MSRQNRGKPVRTGHRRPYLGPSRVPQPSLPGAAVALSRRPRGDRPFRPPTFRRRSPDPPARPPSPAALRDHPAPAPLGHMHTGTNTEHRRAVTLRRRLRGAPAPTPPRQQADVNPVPITSPSRGIRTASKARDRPSMGGPHAAHVPQEFPDSSRGAAEHQPTLLVHHDRWRKPRTEAHTQQHRTSYDIG